MADVTGLPNDLVNVVKALHGRIQQMADQRIEQAHLEFKTSNDELHKELSESRQTITQLTSRKQDMEHQIERLTAEIEVQKKSLDNTCANLAKAEVQRDEAIKRVTELKKAVAELKQENRDIRDHFDHYQEKAAEDRQQQRDQHRTSSQLLQDQVQDLQGRLTQAETTTSQLLDTNSQLRRSVDELNQSNATLNEVMNRKSEEIENLKRHLEVALTKSQEYGEQKTQLTEQMAALVRQKTDIDKELALLSQTLETTRADLIAAQDKTAFLTDENKVILQEKAVIQGQFKQLQSAL